MEVSRLSIMDDDLFTYEVEVANISCDSKMDNDSEQEADDHMGYDPSDIRRDDEIELTDKESPDDEDDIAEDSKPKKITRMIGSMNGTRTYHGSMRSHRPTDWRDDGYCNGGNLPGTYIIENQLHYHDYEWYEALEDSELKNEALRNKAIMEGSIKEDDDESQLCEIREQSVCNIRRYMMIKYSFNDDEEYVVVKEDEYDDFTVTRKEAYRAYQEIFQIMDEGWMVTRAE
ncbi:hypothetical protein Tco_0360222 [Tanacetum coccineum]